MSERLTKLLELLHELPHDTFLKYGVALEYVSRNDDATALQHFNELRRLEPDYLPMYYQMGKLYERINQTENAIKAYNDGIVLAREQKDTHTMSELQSALDELW
jgi:tetratricopeptide (TPR) repeat protein